MGNKLLTARAGLFVADSDDRIKIELRGLDAAFQIKGSALKEICSKEAWNPPKDALDCSTLVYEIAHVDESKSTFFGKISASHVGDHAKADIMADFDKDVDGIEMESSHEDCKGPKVTVKALEIISRKTKKEESAVPQSCIKIPRKLGVRIPRVFFILAVIMMANISGTKCTALNDNYFSVSEAVVVCDEEFKCEQTNDADAMFARRIKNPYSDVVLLWYKYSLILMVVTDASGNPSYDGRPEGIIPKESGEKHIESIRLTAETAKESGEKLNADQTKIGTRVLLSQQPSLDGQEGNLKHMTGSTKVNVFGYTPLDRVSGSTHACSFKGVSMKSNVCSEKHGRSENRKKRVSYVTPPSKKRSFKGGSSRIDPDAQNRNPPTPADSKESRWNTKAGLKVLAGETKEPDEFFFLSAMMCMKSVN